MRAIIIIPTENNLNPFPYSGIFIVFQILSLFHAFNISNLDL